MVKECTKCGEEKALTEFYKEKDGKYGVKSRCKECISELVREYRLRPEIRERKREHLRRPEVQERNREYQSKYRQCSYVLDRKRKRDREDARLRKELGLVSNKHFEVTKKYATRKGSWSDAEVKFLMTSDLPLVDIALELGRTYQSVYSKRLKVRKKLEAQQ